MLTPEFILDEKDDDVKVSKKQVIKMLYEHDLHCQDSFDDFYEDCGVLNSYPLHVVLAWLGY